MLDVIWIDDDFIKPPGPKMVVCVAPLAGFFFRINTPPYPVPVKLLKVDNPFLAHDSFLECNGPLDIDDYIIEVFLKRNGVPIGTVAAKVIPEIWTAVARNGRFSPETKAIIRRGLGFQDE